ncbi:MFS transporter [Yimella sp. cx-51]|uniref:MFS transporter n=1 Tax=Yimella sp. cx-51 TaxID=2770551 RepID=UPI00165E7B5D|nr:MFS transporter [Yimella sp. cx-51]MBC9955989.1 MFS transporter [Yimella sp. cx-51]QTH37473.1 MFS transporter [Yimella sp. cx-51]
MSSLAKSADSTDSTQELTRSQRLDRLPFTRLHGRLLGGSGVGWALDAMDVGLISFLMVAIKKDWGLSTGQVSWLASVGFIGMAVGASVGGYLADRIGRRNVFALTLVIYGLATGFSALSTGFWMLVVFRFVIGLGLGAELPVASTLVSEYAPARIRGRMVVLLESFWAVGWILAALIGYYVVPQENGWRWALVIGVVPAFYALYVRRGLPESVRFLERAGRVDEAEASVRRFEESAGIAPVPSPAPKQIAKPSWKALWEKRFAGRTVALWLTWFGVNFSYYGAFLWIPTFLVAQGFPMAKSFEFTLWITLAQLPGYAVAAVLIEKVGRRFTLASFLLGSAVSAIAFGQSGSETAILVSGCMLSFFNLGAWGALYAVTPEVYPTTFRATGSGSATAFGRIASIIGPLLVPWVHDNHGTGPTFVLIGVSFAVAMLAALGLPEWRGKELQNT